ncbi:type II toxin-antitoxin system VapC family toxin [Salinicola peritrichatus]|uniref:type II toxin-antitoxin system VapC family toxin n=1 Tax=Salinicola peritrichatus TaxID=1267424 RepID=UPI000DA19604|nr:type II toxin-antitoxin system VapC family toxin [Salinicola peritrichatus]
MSGSYLLDTNVFINAIRRRLQLPAAHYTYSVITELELLGFPGLASEEEHAIQAVLDQLTRVELDSSVRAETIRVRRNTQMKLPDSIICASALVTAATLVTDDVKLAQKYAGDVISLDAFLNL